ncbi:hypothetical protein ACVDG8_034175 [Mesorhizobium sp. ORM8.1]
MHQRFSKLISAGFVASLCFAWPALAQTAAGADQMCDIQKLCADCPALNVCAVAGRPPNCVQTCRKTLQVPIPGQPFDVIIKGLTEGNVKDIEKMTLPPQ